MMLYNFMGVSSTGLHPGLFRFNPFGVGGYVCLCCLPPDHRISSGDIDVQPLRGWRVCGCVVDRLSFGLHPGLFRFNPFGVGGYVGVLFATWPPVRLSTGLHPGLFRFNPFRVGGYMWVWSSHLPPKSFLWYRKNCPLAAYIL